MSCRRWRCDTRTRWHCTLPWAEAGETIRSQRRRARSSNHERSGNMRTMSRGGIGTMIGILLLAGQALAGSDTEDEYRAVLRARVDASHGEILFATCSRCHGADGNGATDGSVPALAGQHVRVLARQLVDYRHDQRWDVRMEHFADFPYLIFAQDVADVAAYVSGLPRGRSPVTGSGEYLEAGGRIYALRCASCHG